MQVRKSLRLEQVGAVMQVRKSLRLKQTRAVMQVKKGSLQWRILSVMKQ